MKTPVLAITLCGAAALLPPTSADEISYNRDVRPLLSDKCFHCHGPDANHREADLRLDVEEAAKDYAIVPGDIAASEFIRRMTSADPDERMPPADSGKKLSDAEISLLRRWVAEGAEYEPYWAWVPPKRHAVPTATDTNWGRNWIDRFVLDRLQKEGLTPARAADPVTLFRRLSFDLTGLPPNPDDVKAFVRDPSPAAFEQAVDKLLASDHFGEQMAMYWLDLVRYADTVGYHGDQDHNISPYRDWVIDAFNANMPFDQFTREQLAGDLLPNAGIDQKIATGYNRLLQTSHEGGVQQKEYLAIYAADRVRNVSAVWMGATMGCCQCHDHKYDPFTMRDFYSMVAFFADVDEAGHFTKGGNSLPTARPPEMKVLTRREREYVQRLQERLDALVAHPDADSDVHQKQLKQLRDELKAARSAARTTMVTVSIKPRTIRVLPRGNWLDDSGPVVQPAVPDFMGRAAGTSRLDLANWLTDAGDGRGGLTARVFANRLWYLMFGRGLSPSLDDFGGQGEPPSHPELLDNLAVEFHESGWNIKHLIKLMVMSSAYQQSSLVSPELEERDPYNTLLARQARYRLPAEMIRDNALAIAGLLVTDYGGASAKPYQPTGYYRHLNFPTRKYKHHSDNRQWRRGVYVHWQRQFLHPMLKAFDAPSREECTARRDRSNTPVAALTLMNDPTFVEAARVFAERIIREGGADDASRLTYAFSRALSRTPDSFEQKLLLNVLFAEAGHYATDRAAAEKLIQSGQAPTADDLDPVRLASWTAVARALLNMSETISRN